MPPKHSYTGKEVARIHNIYRLIIIIMIVGFLWVLHYYKVSDQVLSNISGGQIKISEGESFWKTFITFAKWISSVGAIIFGLYMIWDKFIKKDK